MRRTVLGLVLVSEGDGRWRSVAHPHLTVERDDDFVTECDGGHPTRDGGYHENPTEHFYTRWGVWDDKEDDFAFNSSPGEFESFKEAAEWLAGQV